jgi:hypothetical protein
VFFAMVTGDAGDRHRVAQQRGLAVAKYVARGKHLRQHAVGHAQQAEQGVVPAVCADVEEHRARGVRHVGGVHLPARELPQQPAVDGTEGELALRGQRVRAGHVVEEPAHLGGREVRVDDKPRGGADRLRVTRLAQLRAGRLAAAVLPDDRVVDRLACAAVPQHGGFALVRDAHAGEVARGKARSCQRLARGGQLRLPDFLGVVLDPARLRVDLPKLALRHRNDAALRIEDDAA